MPYPSDAWIHMRINNHMHRSNDLKIYNAETTEGDFYDPEYKGIVVPRTAINHMVAHPNETMDVAASGVDGASEGGYDLYDGDTKICHIGWNVPRVETADSFGVSHCNDNYMVRYKGAHLEHGPIGDVDIIVKEIH